MTYTEPEVVLTANAAQAIQGCDVKWLFIFCLDANYITYDAIFPAYEADE